MVNCGSAASPPTTSTSSGTRAVPERLTIRTVSPRRSRASRVARPIAPVPKMTCRGVLVMPCPSIVGGGRVGASAVVFGGAVRQQRVQQDPGEGGEGDGTAGAEDGELLLHGDPGEGGDDPAERPEQRHGDRPPPAPARPAG